MTTGPVSHGMPADPRPPVAESHEQEGVRPAAGAVKCVGAFLRPCSNQTDTILCAECYSLIDKVMSPTRNRSGSLTLTKYRRRNRAKAAA